MTHASLRDPRLDRLPPLQPPPDIDPALLETAALKVVARLRRHGYEAYLVGGCVRDLLVGALPKDFDVVTGATPEQVRRVFRNCRLIGRRFRLAHVFAADGSFVEVATFRAAPVQAADDTADDTEGEEAADSGDDLLVTDDNQFGTAEEDARRRDFTVNGLLYDAVEGRTIDHVGGRADLDARIIRTIGDPEIRLREDPVRGLRAARIAAKLGFSIDPATFQAMQRHADELPRCAPARVLDETLKLLRCGAAATALRTLHDAGLLRVLLPPVDRLLDKGGEPTETGFFARLKALDALLATGAEVGDAVMLALVLSQLPVHHHDSAGAEGAGFDEPHSPPTRGLPSVEKVLSQMAAHARLPRRISERVVMLLEAQEQFVAPPRKKRRRGGSGGFANTSHFPEALQLLELLVAATGKHADVLERWKEKFRQARQDSERRQAARAAEKAEALVGQEQNVDVENVSIENVSVENVGVENAGDEPSAPADAEAKAATESAAPAKRRRRRRRKGGGSASSDGVDQAVSTGEGAVD